MTQAWFDVNTTSSWIDGECLCG